MEIFNFDEKKTVTVNNTNVTVIGDYDNPWFAGKAICEALGYKDPKDTLARLKQKHKAPLNKLKKEEGQKPYDFFGHLVTFLIMKEKQFIFPNKVLTVLLMLVDYP
jgi:prophage antirepressor-like protein